MKLMLVSVSVVIAAGMALMAHGVASAEVAQGVRIVLIQAAGTDAKFERIDIENTSDRQVDVTNWKLIYKTASGNSPSSPVQVELVTDTGWHILLDPRTRESFLSKEFAVTFPADSLLRQAEQFTGGLNTLGGSVQLVDAEGGVVDMVGWGTATESVRHGSAAPALTATTWLVRHAQNGNNTTDFALESQDSTLTPPVVGSLYEVQDICTNLSGLQWEVPDSYQLAGAECHPIDACPNLEGLQSDLPIGMEYGDAGECRLIDSCLNLEGLQVTVPVGYEPFGERQCRELIPIRQLLITELLPNPSGSDDGNEFIELYNADTQPALLRHYRLVIGGKAYPLPDQELLPGRYITVSDADLGGNLPNTTGAVVLLTTVYDAEVAEAPAYMNARNDMSWALMDGKWQYTYALTPGGENVLLASLPCQSGYTRDQATSRCRKVEVRDEVVPAPCRDGQYRNEETGRCRNLVAPASLTPCKEGQYRSEETNRCRSLATLAVSTLKPCADDQFRNPLTNRCKSIASSDDVALADCGEGRERNPATNRCRNVVSAAAPMAAFPVEPIKDTAAAFAGWWVLGGVGALALGYAGWEWRREAASLITRIRTFFLHK